MIWSASPCSRVKSSGSPGPAPLWERIGIPLLEPEGKEYTGYRRSNELLAWFAQMYLIPDHMTLERRNRYTWLGYMNHVELEENAPYRHDWFERMLYGRSVERRSYLQAHPDATSWPGMCEPPKRLAWALDRLPPLPKFSKLKQFDSWVPAGFKCGAVDLH